MTNRRPTLRQQQRRHQIKQQEAMAAKIAAQGGVASCILLVDEWATRTKRYVDVLAKDMGVVQVDFGTWEGRMDAMQMLRFALEAAAHSLGDGFDSKLVEQAELAHAEEVCKDVWLVATISRRNMANAHGDAEEVLKCTMHFSQATRHAMAMFVMTSLEK